MARIVELVPGLRAVNAGALEMARIVEQLTPLLISINARYKRHAGIRITGLGGEQSLGVVAGAANTALARSPLMRIALLAGGTGGAKLAAGMQELAGQRPFGDRQHGRRHPGPRPPRVAGSRPDHLLAGGRDRRGARLGDQGRLVHGPRAPRRARRPGLVPALRSRPRHLPLPDPLRRRGRHADRRPGTDRAGARGARRRAADVRAARAHARPDPRRLARAPGIS